MLLAGVFWGLSPRRAGRTGPAHLPLRREEMPSGKVRSAPPQRLYDAAGHRAVAVGAGSGEQGKTNGGPGAPGRGKTPPPLAVSYAAVRSFVRRGAGPRQAEKGMTNHG